MIIPSHLQIETINGACTSRCTMCTYATWTRKPRRMDQAEFETILKKFLPYREKLLYLTLHGCGEPLLDRELPAKIHKAKELGFKGTGLATNCTELNEKTAEDLLRSGLDTIILSVDGVTRETHESIRKGTNFNAIVKNVQGFLAKRPRYGKTRVLVRFIRQNSNAHEWPDFYAFWEQQIDNTYGDAVIKFDVHNWGEKLDDYASKDVLAHEGGVYLYVKIFISVSLSIPMGEWGFAVLTTMDSSPWETCWPRTPSKSTITTPLPTTAT